MSKEQREEAPNKPLDASITLVSRRTAVGQREISRIYHIRNVKTDLASRPLIGVVVIERVGKLQLVVAIRRAIVRRYKADRDHVCLWVFDVEDDGRSDLAVGRLDVLEHLHLYIFPRLAKRDLADKRRQMRCCISERPVRLLAQFALELELTCSEIDNGLRPKADGSILNGGDLDNQW